MIVRGTKPIVRVSVECPHCGFEQLESQAAQSTICRNCGSHFDIAPKAAESAPARPAQPNPLSVLVRKPQTEQQRTVACFVCNATHRVSSLAKTTLCPSCGAYIDLQDFEITGLFSRSIRTRGRLVVQARGDLNCAKTLCGSAVIEGRLRGGLVCEGKAVLKCRGKLPGDIEASHLVIERGAEIEFLRPVRAGRIEILGKAAGTFYCGTEIYIHRKAALTGAVHARAFVVEHGGLFVGDTEIRPVQQWAEGFRFSQITAEPARGEALGEALGY